MPNYHTPASSSSLIYLLSTPSSHWTPQMPWITCTFLDTPWRLMSPRLGFLPAWMTLSSFISCPNMLCLLRPTAQRAVLVGHFACRSGSQSLAWRVLKNTHCSGTTPKDSDYFKRSPSDSSVLNLILASIILIDDYRFICLSARCKHPEGKRYVILSSIPNA